MPRSPSATLGHHFIPPRQRPVLAMLAPLLLAAACACCQPHHDKDPSMPPTLFKEFGLNTKPVEVPPVRAIAPSRESSPPPATRPEASAADGYLYPFANAQLNSRLAAALPAADVWERVVTTPIAEDFIPHAIIASGRRVVLSTPLGLLAFDAEGRPLGRHLPAMSDGIITPAHSHILYEDSNGFIAGHPVGEGAARFQLSPTFGNVFKRDLIAFVGSTLVVVGQKSAPPTERPEAKPPPPEAVIDAWRWTDPVEADGDGYATNLKSVRSLVAATPRLLAAASGQSLFVAVPDHLYVLDTNLSIQHVFAGAFDPLAMSCDTTGRIYLIVRGKPAGRLLVITPGGQQVAAVELPPPSRGGYSPPIIGYNHTVYIPTEDRIIVVDASGQPQPSILLEGHFAGAAVTADHQLLVASGSRLSAHRFGEEPVVLAEFTGESLRTAPVLLRSGTIWIATDRNLYSLRPSPQ